MKGLQKLLENYVCELERVNLLIDDCEDIDCTYRARIRRKEEVEAKIERVLKLIERSTNPLKLVKS